MVNISDKAGEYNINCKNDVDYVFHKENWTWQVSKKCKLKWADPG